MIQVWELIAMLEEFPPDAPVVRADGDFFEFVKASDILRIPPASLQTGHISEGMTEEEYFQNYTKDAVMAIVIK